MGESLYEVFSLEWWLSQGVIAEDTDILSSSYLPGVHLAIMYLAPLIHEGQALRVAVAKRARHIEHVRYARMSCRVRCPLPGESVGWRWDKETRGRRCEGVFLLS